MPFLIRRNSNIPIFLVCQFLATTSLGLYLALVIGSFFGMAVVKTSEASSSTDSLPSMTGTGSIPSKPETKVADVALLKDLDKAVVDDADFLAWLNKNQDADPLSYYTEHSRRDSRDSLTGMAPAPGERRSRASSLLPESAPEHGEGPPSPTGRILHVLHLDRKARKHAARLRAQLTKQAMEEQDMEQWEARIRAEYAAQRERSASQTSARSQSAGDGQDNSSSDDSSDTDSPAPSLSNQNTTVHTSETPNPEVDVICERVDQLVQEFHELRERTCSNAEESLPEKGREDGRGTVTFGLRDEGEAVKVMA